VGVKLGAAVLLAGAASVVIGAAMLAGRLGEGTGVQAFGAALLLFGAAGILTTIGARRMKRAVDAMAEQAGAQNEEKDGGDATR
jgi:hypothetical protein